MAIQQSWENCKFEEEVDQKAIVLWLILKSYYLDSFTYFQSNPYPAGRQTPLSDATTVTSDERIAIMPYQQAGCTGRLV